MTDGSTLETVYKVAICPRENLPYKQVYFINDPKVTLKCCIGALKCIPYVGDGEPGITDLGITESGITESGITWEIGIRYKGTWYNRISYNIKVECGIMESSITETSITRKFKSGIWYNTKKESAITESGITESGITRKRNLA